MSKTAIIIGSSGLVGGHLLQLLSKDSSYEKIIAIVRKQPLVQYEKVEFIVHNFQHLTELEPLLKGDSLFICIGSTIAKAGSKEAFSYVDFEIPVNIAAMAKQNGVDDCFVVSALGANSHSSNFYIQTKGKMEDAIAAIPFTRVAFLRPSLLLGNRIEKRTGEKAAIIFMNLFDWLFIGPLKKYKGIEAHIVAENLIHISKTPFTGIKIVENNEMLDLN